MIVIPYSPKLVIDFHGEGNICFPRCWGLVSVWIYINEQKLADIRREVASCRWNDIIWSIWSILTAVKQLHEPFDDDIVIQVVDQAFFSYKEVFGDLLKAAMNPVTLRIFPMDQNDCTPLNCSHVLKTVTLGNDKTAANGIVLSRAIVRPEKPIRPIPNGKETDVIDQIRYMLLDAERKSPRNEMSTSSLTFAMYQKIKNEIGKLPKIAEKILGMHNWSEADGFQGPFDVRSLYQCLSEIAYS